MIAETADKLSQSIIDTINNSIAPNFKEHENFFIQTNPFVVDNQTFSISEKESNNWIIKKEIISHVSGYTTCYSVNRQHPFYLYLWNIIYRQAHLWGFGLSVDGVTTSFILNGFDIFE